MTIEMSIERNPDGHLHAFVFIDHTVTKIAEVLTNLAVFRRSEFPRVRWAGSVIGDYLGFAHVEAEDPNDLSVLQDFVENDLWDAGARCMWSTELAVINSKGTKHSTPEILSLVGIKTEHGRTRAVAERLSAIDAERDFGLFKGASIITGNLDILVQLNTETFVEAQDRLFVDEEFAEILAGIEGIAWTSTAIADGGRGPFREPFEEYVQKS